MYIFKISRGEENLSNSIIQYQGAFQSMIKKLEKNSDVLAVLVFGSMVTGDLWEESDIDLIVILNDSSTLNGNIYCSENDVPIHMKIYNKSEFVDFFKNHRAGDFMHRILISSKLVFSHDRQITDRYNSLIYHTDNERNKWSLVYLGELTKSVALCKKYIKNNKSSAYMAALTAVECFSKLFLNLNGYLISKDATAVAANLNNDLKEKYSKLISSDYRDINSIEETIKYFESFVDKNIKKCTEYLLKVLQEKDTYMSSEELKYCEEFKGFQIHMEDLLDLLYKKGIVKKSGRDVLSVNNFVICKENVYKY